MVLVSVKVVVVDTKMFVHVDAMVHVIRSDVVAVGTAMRLIIISSFIMCIVIVVHVAVDMYVIRVVVHVMCETVIFAGVMFTFIVIVIMDIRIIVSAIMIYVM